MSTPPNSGPDEAVRPQTAAPGRPRRRTNRVALLALLSLLGLLVILATGLAWYAGTASFQSRVRRAVIAQLEKSTGGRVTLAHFGWHLAHLEFTVDDLTIHGLEAPGQVPYAHVDRLYVRLRILAFFRPKIGLNYLEADHLIFHLIVYPDGTTNQPHPKRPSTGSAKNEIFNLAITRAVLNNGLAILNQKKIPFNLSANHLDAQVSYVPALDHYAGTIHAEDIVAQRGVQIPVHSVLDASLEAGRNTASLVSLTLQSGPQGTVPQTVIRAAGNLTNFSDPHWNFTIKGAVTAAEIRALAGTPGLQGGIVQMTGAGHGTRSQFAIDGSGRISSGAYSAGTVHLTGLTADAVAHVTQDVIAVTGIHGRLSSGGALTGELRIANWQAPAPPAAAPGPEQGFIHAQLAGLTADSILDIVAVQHYRRLGFDTAASGTADVHWIGSPKGLVGSVDISLTPPHIPTPNEVPVNGIVQATYIQGTGTIEIRNLTIHTPASSVEVTGNLGVYPLIRHSQIAVNLVTRDLSEFNPSLAAFGVSHGQTRAIPAQLHGEAQFRGVVSGTLDAPDFRGHLQATNFDITPPSSVRLTGHIHFDSLTADAAYSAGSLTVNNATLVQGKTTIQLSGDVRGPLENPGDLFAESSSIRGDARIQNLDLAQWLALTGKGYPVSGNLSLQIQGTGTIGDIDGNGRLIIAGGEVYGETYRSLTADVHVRGRDLSVSNLAFAIDGGRITGSAGYNLSNKSVSFNLQGSGFSFSRIPRLQNAQYPITGSMLFDARGSGSLDSPHLQANLHLRDLTLARESHGFIDAAAHTQGRALLVDMTAHLNTAVVDLTSQTQLTGDYQTHAGLSVARFDIDPLLRTFSVSGIRGNSSIAAALTVSGPLKYPKQLSGDARISQLNINLEGVPIHSEGDIHATLRDGTLHLDTVHIVGTDTDLHAEGSLGLFSKPRPLHATASGAINIALAQTLDTDIISSGHVDFNVEAQGTSTAPDLTGQVRFTNVNVALQDYTNGLSRMNGSLVFDQNRLDFKDVTAYSGGGLIRLGGFVTYQHGLYADVSATAKEVRIRYPQGVTSTANADLRFQGTRASMVLSGHVTLVGFAVSPQLNVASLQTAASGVSLPRDPSSPSNRVRLDIHITSAPSLNFQNSFARLAGNVDLSIRGTLAQPTVLGRVTITEGTATFNGDKFEVQHGEIYFSNPVRIQPVIDLIATTTVEDYTITIGLQGTAAKLNPTFRSEPPLSEQDIFSLLAMGRTQEEEQIYSTEEAQAGVNSTADSLLGGALNATISSRIQKLFGGGSVRIDPTFVSGVGNATARITITEPVSKQATLTYATNVNSTAEQLIQGEFRLTQDFSILAVRDEAGVFSLIFRLHRRYR